MREEELVCCRDKVAESALGAAMVDSESPALLEVASLGPAGRWILLCLYCLPLGPSRPCLTSPVIAKLQRATAAWQRIR